MKPALFDETTGRWIIATLSQLPAPARFAGDYRDYQDVPRFWGYVVEAGPLHEEDFSDERYWIQRASIEIDDNGHFNLWNWENSFGDPAIYEATNLSELKLDLTGLYSSGKHALEVGTPAMVFQNSSAELPTVARYWFISGGGGTGETCPQGEQFEVHQHLTANTCGYEFLMSHP